MVLYHVDNIEPYLMEVNLPQQSISDITLGVISEIIITKTYEELGGSMEKLVNDI